MAKGTPVTDEQRSLIISLSDCPNCIIHKRTGFSTQTIAQVLKQAMQTEITITKHTCGEWVFSSHGKPIPCNITIKDYDYDPHAVDSQIDLKTDEDGDDYAEGIFYRGERLR
jgi:hypothetical protein